MAQVTSQTVPGGSGLSVRTNMNNIFGALFSSSSGATAPTTTVAGMLWFDTGAVPAVLKRRNSANTGWDKVNPGVSVSDQSGGYTVVEGDRNSFIRCTSATTITFPSAVTLGDDWSTIVKADGGDVVLDPDGSETINGVSTLTLENGASGIVFSNGSALYLIRIPNAAMTPLARIEISNDASADFTTFDSAIYDSYVFDYANLTPNTDAAALIVRTSANGGAGFDAGASDYSWSYVASSESAYGFGDGSGADSRIRISVGTGSGAGEDGVSGRLILNNPGMARKTQMTYQSRFIRESDNQYQSQFGGGTRESSAAVDAIRFLMTVGNIESGTITMYGIRRA